MLVNWNLNHVELNDGLRSHMEERIGKLEKRLKSWANDAVQLTVTLEKVGAKEQFRCILNLSLPQRTLHAEELRDEKKTAFNDCYEDLLRQEKKMMARLRRKDSFTDVANAKRSLGEPGPLAPGTEEEE